MLFWRSILSVSLSIAMLGVGSGTLRAEDALASTDGEMPGTRAEITQLKRIGGDAVMLRFTVFNDGGKSLSFGSLLNSRESRSVDGVYLVDLAGKKKYEVIRDAEKRCVCSRDVQDVNTKSSVNLWAKFPAPADSVEKIGVTIPHFIPIDDVPLTR